MPRKPLVWKLFPIYFLITLISISVIGFYASESLKDFYYSQAEADLAVRTKLIEQEIVSMDFSPKNAANLNALVRSFDEVSNTRVTIIAPSGKVIADSESNPKVMENHADRPEFMQALAGNTGKSRRRSDTLGYTMLYLAIPIERDGEIIGALRTSLAATALDAPPVTIYHQIAIGTLLIAFLAGIASLLVARRISGPLTEMEKTASRFADGDLRSRIALSDTEEFASLANTLNKMAEQLDRQLKTITQQSTEQQAILSSMKEGVVAIDNEDRILILNPTAEQLIGTTIDLARGKTIQEAIRNSDLQRFFEKSRASLTPTTEEISYHIPEPKLIQATGTSLVDTNGRNIGVLVILNDITQTRKLENIRKDFVANVSHELKTPITSIKGFVETLREGALDDPTKAHDFLDIVARQADRLNSIIEDLLALSKLEQDTETNEIPLQLSPICNVIQAAITDCETKAAEFNINISSDCEPELAAMINPPLLEEAITNLIDNAIKYSPNGQIAIAAKKAGANIIIRVTDTGTGIEAEHLPRLFERFYRVDKARSRKLGGTGLGLAIVKHIVQAHHGRIDVQSTLGKGSTFSIYLPGYVNDAYL